MAQIAKTFGREHVTVLPIRPQKNVISTVDISVLSFTSNRSLTEKSVEFAISDTEQTILAGHNYRTDPVQ